MEQACGEKEYNRHHYYLRRSFGNEKYNQKDNIYNWDIFIVNVRLLLNLSSVNIIGRGNVVAGEGESLIIGWCYPTYYIIYMKGKCVCMLSLQNNLFYSQTCPSTKYA